MDKTFKEDWRKKNPSLHLLYVKQAVEHLTAIDKCLAKLDRHSNLNLHGAILALMRERNKLVRINAAYADAEEILQSLKPKQEN